MRGNVSRVAASTVTVLSAISVAAQQYEIRYGIEPEKATEFTESSRVPLHNEMVSHVKVSWVWGRREKVSHVTASRVWGRRADSVTIAIFLLSWAQHFKPFRVSGTRGTPHLLGGSPHSNPTNSAMRGLSGPPPTKLSNMMCRKVGYTTLS